MLCGRAQRWLRCTVGDHRSRLLSTAARLISVKKYAEQKKKYDSAVLPLCLYLWYSTYESDPTSYAVSLSAKVLSASSIWQDVLLLISFSITGYVMHSGWTHLQAVYMFFKGHFIEYVSLWVCCWFFFTHDDTLLYSVFAVQSRRASGAGWMAPTVSGSWCPRPCTSTWRCTRGSWDTCRPCTASPSTGRDDASSR